MIEECSWSVPTTCFKRLTARWGCRRSFMCIWKYFVTSGAEFPRLEQVEPASVQTEMFADTFCASAGVRWRPRRVEFVSVVAPGDRDHTSPRLQQPHLQHQQQLQHPELAGPAGQTRGYAEQTQACTFSLFHVHTAREDLLRSSVLLQRRRATAIWKYQRLKGGTVCRAVIGLTGRETTQDLCSHTSQSSDICRRHSTPRYGSHARRATISQEPHRNHTSLVQIKICSSGESWAWKQWYSNS